MFDFEQLESRELFAGGPTVQSVRITPSVADSRSASIVFIIAYRDANGIDPTSFDARDVRVAGPDGYARYARAYSSTSNVTGTQRVVRYKIPTPSAAGKYTVRLRGNEVFDIDGNSATQRALGTFTVNKITGGDTFIPGGAPLPELG